MNVLYIERNLAADSIVFDQIRRIASQQIAVHAIAVQVGAFPHFHHADVSSARCPSFPKLEAAKGALFCRAARRTVARLIDTGRTFDVIHANFVYPEGLAAYLAAKDVDLPFVITGRGDDVLLYPHANRYLHNSVHTVLNGCAAYIGVSQHLCDRARELGAGTDRCTVIPAGVAALTGIGSLQWLYGLGSTKPARDEEGHSIDSSRRPNWQQ